MLEADLCSYFDLFLGAEGWHSSCLKACGCHFGVVMEDVFGVKPTGQGSLARGHMFFICFSYVFVIFLVFSRFS